MSNQPPVQSELLDMISRIGIARFEGRLESGFIDRAAGLAAIEEFVRLQRQRPLGSRIATFFLNSDEAYDH